jgi:hypothetical protein
MSVGPGLFCFLLFCQQLAQLWHAVGADSSLLCSDPAAQRGSGMRLAARDHTASG